MHCHSGAPTHGSRGAITRCSSAAPYTTNEDKTPKLCSLSIYNAAAQQPHHSKRRVDVICCCDNFREPHGWPSRRKPNHPLRRGTLRLCALVSRATSPAAGAECTTAGLAGTAGDAAADAQPTLADSFRYLNREVRHPEGSCLD